MVTSQLMATVDVGETTMLRSDMTAAAESTIDRAAVAQLAQRVVAPLDKGWPPETWGRTVADVASARLPLSAFPTPLMTLSGPAVQHNIEALAAWTSEHGMALAPHGKTTMAPQLWAAQLDAGALGITLANVHQLAVARSFGVRRVLGLVAIAEPGHGRSNGRLVRLHIANLRR